VSCIEDTIRDLKSNFIEGIMFNAASRVVILRQMTNVTTNLVVRFTRL